MEAIKKHSANESTTRSTIFRAAAKLFAEKGYNGVSMREISEQSRVTKPTIYYYFGNKEGIYKALIREGLDYHKEEMRRIAALKTPVRQKLVELLKRTFQISLKHPELTKFVLKLFIPYENLPFLKSYSPETTIHKKILVDLIQEGINTGEFGVSAKPQLAVEVIGGVLTYFILRQGNSNEIILSDKLAEEIIELLFKGLNE